MDLHEEIAKVAYELYEKSGRLEGRDLENWCKAERIVLARLVAKGSGRGNETVSAGKKPETGKASRRR